MERARYDGAATAGTISEIVAAIRTLHIGEPAKISRALFLADELFPAITHQQVMHAGMHPTDDMRDLALHGRDKCGYTSLSGGIHPNVYFAAHPDQSAQSQATYPVFSMGLKSAP